MLQDIIAGFLIVYGKMWEPPAMISKVWVPLQGLAESGYPIHNILHLIYMGSMALVFGTIWGVPSKYWQIWVPPTMNV